MRVCKPFTAMSGKKWRGRAFPDHEDAQKRSRIILPQGSMRRVQAQRLHHMGQDVLQKPMRFRGPNSRRRAVEYDVYHPADRGADSRSKLLANMKCPPIRTHRSGQSRLHGAAANSGLAGLPHGSANARHSTLLPMNRRTRCGRRVERGFTAAEGDARGRDASITAVHRTRPPEASLFYTASRICRASRSPIARSFATRRSSSFATRCTCLSELLTFCPQRVFPGTPHDLGRVRPCRTAKPNYRSRILKFTTPIRIRRRFMHSAQRRVARVCTSRCSPTMKETGFAGDFPLPCSSRSCARDPQFYAKTPEELLCARRGLPSALTAKLRSFSTDCCPSCALCHQAGARRSGAFLYRRAAAVPACTCLNTYNLPGRPLYNLTALTLHESRPATPFRCRSRSSKQQQRIFGSTPISPRRGKAGRCTAAKTIGCRDGPGRHVPTTASAC